MTKKNKTIKDLVLVLSARVLTLSISILAALLVPIFIPLVDYGWYKIFILYMGYVGLLHLGFNDGIYIEYGGHNIDELPKEKFRGYFRYLLIKQLFFTVLLVTLSYVLFDGPRLFIFMLIAVNITCTNLITYYNFISQITQKFKIYSLVTFLQKLAGLFPILLFLIGLERNFETLVLTYTITDLLIVVFYLVYYRGISFGKTIRCSIKNAFELYKFGIPLLIANFLSILIFNNDKQFIDIFIKDLELFSIYAFAVSMLAVILTFVESISQILYPIVKRTESSLYPQFYKKVSKVILVISMCGLASYFILNIILVKIIPKYEASLSIFMILLPAIALRTETAVSKRTFIIAEKRQTQNLIINAIVVVVAVILNSFAVYFFGTIESIAIASLITFMFWYVVLDAFFYNIGYNVYIKKYLYIILCILMYVLLIYLGISNIYSFVIYLLFAFTLGIVLFYKTFTEIYKMIRK